MGVANTGWEVGATGEGSGMGVLVAVDGVGDFDTHPEAMQRATNNANQTALERKALDAMWTKKWPLLLPIKACSL